MNKPIKASFLLLLGTFSNLLFAECTNIEGIEILNFGLYSIKEVRVENIDSNPDGKVRVFQNIINTEKTWNIPAKLKTSFGLKYKIAGAPLDCETEIKRVTLYPEPGLKNPQTGSSINSLEKKLKLKVGQSYALGFIFNEPWEMVKGEWKYQLWHNNHLLAEKTFYVE